MPAVFSPSETSAAPTMPAKNSTCSTLVSAMALIGFVGTMPISTSSGLGIVRGFTSPSGRFDRPRPGSIRWPKAMPTSTAMAEVAMNQNRVRNPKLATLPASASFATLEVMVKNTSGMTIIRTRFR